MACNFIYFAFFSSHKYSQIIFEKFLIKSKYNSLVMLMLPLSNLVLRRLVKEFVQGMVNAGENIIDSSSLILYNRFALRQAVTTK
jgi:hypothetical protein